jgi:hypothetical protein
MDILYVLAVFFLHPLAAIKRAHCTSKSITEGKDNYEIGLSRFPELVCNFVERVN